VRLITLFVPRTDGAVPQEEDNLKIRGKNEKKNTSYTFPKLSSFSSSLATKKEKNPFFLKFTFLNVKIFSQSIHQSNKSPKQNRFP